MAYAKMARLCYTLSLISTLFGCGSVFSGTRDNDLPRFDDLLGYIEDGTFVERYVSEPHQVTDFGILGSTYFLENTPNASAEFARYILNNPQARLSGVTLYTDNPGGVPYEERRFPESRPGYLGNFFKYTCPVSDTPCQFDPARVQRITPREYNAVREAARGEGDIIRIPISDYADENLPYARVKVNRDVDGQLRGLELNTFRGLRWYDINARIAGGDGVTVRTASYGFISRKLIVHR